MPKSFKQNLIILTGVMPVLLIGLGYSITLVGQKTSLGTKAAASGNLISNVTMEKSAMILWGDSAYHDSLGARDPYMVKSGSEYYLFYDCIEDLINPSFESNLGTNGWDIYQATISSTDAKYKFGSRSLKVVTNNVSDAGAYTGNYYYDFLKTGRVNANLAVPSGLEVTPNTTYVASAYVWAESGKKVKLIVQQYKDDPSFYWQNLIGSATKAKELSGNNSWQHIYVSFTSDTNARAITISLVGAPLTTSYWDGIRLKRLNTGEDPSSVTFPSDPAFNTKNYNRVFEDLVGWKPCVAKSSNGSDFSKQGLVEITGTKQEWEKKEKIGYVGSSVTYLNPFYYNGYWYSYTWVAGYEVKSGNRFLMDPGLTDTRRFGYGDRRSFVPNGEPTRSGLVRASSITGPYTRIAVTPPLLPSRVESPCTSTSLWGCDYLAASGAPFKISNKWLMFTSGLKDWDESWKTISSGLSVSSSPTSGWKITPNTPFLANDITNKLVFEGPIYYFDKGSGYHVVFVNDIWDPALDAQWSRNLFTTWDKANRREVIGSYSTNLLWANKGGAINLAGVAESQDATKLYVYFGARPQQASTYNRAYNNNLFYDIGRLTIPLPLLNKPTKGTELVMYEKIAAGEYKFSLRYFDKSGTANIGITQLIVNNTANWTTEPVRFRGMYVANQSVSGGVTYPVGAYLFTPGAANFGWGQKASINTTLSNKYVDVKVLSVTKVDNYTYEIVWNVKFKQSTVGSGIFNVYGWLSDKTGGGQDTETTPAETFTLYNTYYSFPVLGLIDISY